MPLLGTYIFQMEIPPTIHHSQFAKMLLASLFCLLLPQFSMGANFSPTDAVGDQHNKLILWEPSTGMFSIVQADGTARELQCGLPGDIPLTSDINGDHIAELVVWRPSNVLTSPSTFFLCQFGIAPTRLNLGSVGDVPLSAVDFDGDGRSDFSVWRIATGQWFQTFSAPGNSFAINGWGQPGDVPVPADYDGDGRTDLAIFRPSTAEWFIVQSFSRAGRVEQWGFSSDVPVPGDYDGDGHADIAVWRPSSGNWFIKLSGSGGSPVVVQLGLPSDVPIALDFNTDGHADPVVYRPSTGTVYFKTSLTGPTQSIAVNSQNAVVVNATRQKRALNDFDGDGRTDPAVVRETAGNIVWYIGNPAGGVASQVNWGLTGDVVVPADYTGDGQTDYAVARSIGGGVTWFVLSSSSLAASVGAFGLSGDTVIPADFDGDSKADLAVVRAGADGALNWFALSSLTGATIQRTWGTRGDQVVTGDFNGDKKSEMTVVRTIDGLLYWFPLSYSDVTQLPAVQWGLAGDILMPGDYDGDGIMDYGVVRNSGGAAFTLLAEPRRINRWANPLGSQWRSDSLRKL